MTNENLVKSNTPTPEPIKQALNRKPLSRNRFLKILAKHPAEYHPVFGAYDKAPEMPIKQIANTALGKGDQVFEVECDAIIEEGWTQKGETLQSRGNGLVLVRKPEEVFSASSGQELTPVSISQAVELSAQPQDFIEGIGVYPIEEAKPQVQPAQPNPTLASPISNVVPFPNLQPQSIETAAASQTSSPDTVAQHDTALYINPFLQPKKAA